MGLRKKPRVKMVVPVRLWGTDSSGNPFNVLAHTLNVSSSGARIGGVKVGLAVGEAITLQYKQVRALFKVVWIGRPGDKTEQQIGLALLEQDRQVWAELQEPGTYLDDFAGRRLTPAPPPQPAPVIPAAKVETIPIEEVEAAEDAAPAQMPMPAAVEQIRVLADSSSLTDTNSMMRACARGLLRVEQAVKQQPPDPAAIQEFRDALAKVRQTVWALQQWYEAKSESGKGFPLLAYLNTERLRFVVQATHDLAEDKINKGVELDPELLQKFFDRAERLRSQSGHAGEFTVEVVPPAPAEKLRPESPLAAAVRKAVGDAQQSGMTRAETLQFVAREMYRIFKADGIALASLDGSEMLCEASCGNSPEPGMVLETESGIGLEAVQSRQLVYCRDTQRDARVDAELCASANIGAVLMVPVDNRDGKLIGMIEVTSGRPNAFNDEDLQAFRHAAQSAAPLLAPKKVSV